MGKKSSAKKVRREIENFEKNKVKDLEIKEEKIFVQDINLKELSKYEKIKKFRNLENINITYGDNEKDKFKDFQEIYNLISNEIGVQGKREIYSKKDKIFYFLQHKLFTTERLKGEYSISTSSKEEKNNLNNIKKISNRIREKGIEFSLPDEKSIKLLKNTGFIGNGCWIYYYKENNISYSNYMRISDTYNYSLDCQYEYNLLGIYKLDKFFNFLKDRNQKFNFKENNNLKNFEVILNYDLLDTSIITKEYEERFNKLVEVYKKYKEYISCIYNEDDKKIGILFDTNKIIEAIKNKKKLFNNIEITYLENQLGIEKEIVYSDRNVYYYKNGEIEEIYNNNLGENKSIYHFKNGNIEERIYKDGILKGKAIYKNENKEREYFYTNGIREEMPKLKYYLSIDRERINIDDYQETMLIDPNIGHWDLKEEDKKELKEILGKNVYKKDPKKDINQGGIVAIDFGTKSTVVVYQKDRENILPMRISGDKLNREVRSTDYENPTVIEFRDIDKFLKDYKAKIGRPDTKWEDITVSHNAFRNLVEGTNELSIISDIKQWCASKNENIVIVDRKGKEILLPPYLELNEKSKDYLDPVEIYAYYIGSYINNMINGIYLEYYLSFPVTYEKAIRERILKSFEKGIQKSLPIEIQEDKDLMKKFRVRHGANEPAAFAVCALSKLEIEPKNEEDKVYYGVFDFGGGTTDFDFGIWKYSEDEDLYDYELEHFGAGGERYLGGENILKELAYKVFSDNSSKLRKSQIQYTRPEWYAETVGEEILVSKTREARINTRRLMEHIRTIWEDEGKDRERIDIINCSLFDTNGNFNAIELIINEDELKSIIREKIEKGIKNFFIKMEDAFKGEDLKEISLFLAGNSSQYPYVEEMFKSYEEKMKDKIKLIVYDSNAFKNIKDKDKKIIPTVKTGVAFGLIYSRNSGRIKVISRDEKANINNEINFKFYIGNNRRSKFNCIISPNSSYDEYKFFGIVKSDIFELYYSTSPEAQTNEMKSSEAKIKRINLKKDYDEEDRYRIYLKADESDKLAYAIVEEEKDIETKKFVEEGEVTLN